MNRKSLVRLLLIALAYLSVTLAFASMPGSALQFWYLYYSPVLLAAYSFGLRGALIGSIVAVLHILIFYRTSLATVASLLQLHHQLDALAQFAREPSENMPPITLLTPAQQIVATLTQSRTLDVLNPTLMLSQTGLGMVLIVTSAVLMGWLIDQNRRQEALLAEQARTDALTGLMNYRRLQERLAEEVERAERYDQRFGFLMIDIDHFKHVNDAFGHLVGDRVLQMVARAIQGAVRTVDVVARYGGEEFSVILVQVAPEHIHTIAERIRRAVAQHRCHVDANEPVTVTVSIGYATFPDDAKDVQGLIRCADQALYAAKRAGRNQVRSWQSIATTTALANAPIQSTPIPPETTCKPTPPV